MPFKYDFAVPTAVRVLPLLAIVGLACSQQADSTNDTGVSGDDVKDSSRAGSATAGVRTVSNARVVFHGTELDLATQYELFVQPRGGSVAVVADPSGASGKVIRFREPKRHNGFNDGHVMVRLRDATHGYDRDVSVHEYETSYHLKTEIYVARDPQYQSHRSLGLFEDQHCEPCEANNVLLTANSYQSTTNSLCQWVVYSTDSAFDPRGPDRGGTTDPWSTINANHLVLPIAPDGTAATPANMPPTGSVWLCRDDVRMSDIMGRWVEFEMLVKNSSYHDKGQILLWIDHKPYFYRGANTYRWNENAPGEGDAVEVFQYGLYMDSVTPAAGTPTYYDLYMKPPLLELGDDVVYQP